MNPQLIGANDRFPRLSVVTYWKDSVSKMPTTINPGDVFTAKIPDGRYKAVRVIRIEGEALLTCTCDYLGEECPAPDEPLLRKTLVQNRFFSNGKPARKWLYSKPPPSFAFVANLPPTDEEAAIQCRVHSGKWIDSSCDEAYLEWRWVHDRAAFEEEVRQRNEEAERRHGLPQKPKKMMNEEEFWPIIGVLDWEHEGNDGKVLAAAIEALADKSKAEICLFAERLAYLLYQLDTKAHASHIGKDSYDPASGYVSADGFLYARCVVVANGREFYEAALNDPRKMPKDLEFESLLGLASSAYRSKTGEEFEYSTGCSYESFSNSAGWRRKA